MHRYFGIELKRAKYLPSEFPAVCDEFQTVKLKEIFSQMYVGRFIEVVVVYGSQFPGCVQMPENLANIRYLYGLTLNTLQTWHYSLNKGQKVFEHSLTDLLMLTTIANGLVSSK